MKFTDSTYEGPSSVESIDGDSSLSLKKFYALVWPVAAVVGYLLKDFSGTESLWVFIACSNSFEANIFKDWRFPN